VALLHCKNIWYMPSKEAMGVHLDKGAEEKMITHEVTTAAAKAAKAWHGTGRWSHQHIQCDLESTGNHFMHVQQSSFSSMA